MAQAPSKASGTVKLGITVAHKFLRKTKITMTTRAMVSIKVNCTSSTEARIVVVRSESTVMCIEAGIAACKRVIVDLTFSTVVMTLTPGTLKTTRNTSRLPLPHAAW